VVAADLGDVAYAEIAHRAADLAFEYCDRATRARLAGGADPVERGAADRDRVGAERQTLEDVAAAPEA